MRKNIFLKIGLITTITICMLCLLIKSFLAVRYGSELDGGKMSLVFKINPLGNNLIFEDKGEADFFLRTNPEAYSGTIFDPIFNIPFPIYIFFLLLLISICMKMKNPKLKKRWLIIPTIVIPILIWIIWLFQTYEPSEKIYSTDKQYSYYLEEYNYNLITERVFGMFHETEYKVFVYDEITGKRLYSGYAGGKTILRDYFGFDEGYDQFHLTKPDYIKLPRPIDKKAIKQQQRREKAVNDSIRWVCEGEQIKTEFYRLAPINHDEIAMIAPIIKKWTDFYNIDFSQARLVNRSENVCFNCPPDTSDLYYRKFTKECDTNKRIDVDYSPDKQRYVDLGISFGTYYDEEDKKYYFIGWDDCQEIYLVDRKQKHQNMIIWFGVSSLAEAVFWKSNDVFLVVGYDLNYTYASLILHFVYVFDIKKQTKNRYEILKKIDGDNYDGYMYEVYLKEKGIFVSN